MTSSRIKDPGLGAQLAEPEIAWLRHVTPITEHFCRLVSERDYRGKRLACWMHIRFNNMLMLVALAESGAEIAVGACKVDSTDDAAAAYVAARASRSTAGAAWPRPTMTSTCGSCAPLTPTTCATWAAS